MSGSMQEITKEVRLNTDGSTQPVRFFTDPNVQAAINSALSGIDPGKHGVILEVDMPQLGEVKGVLAARLNDHWSIGLVGSYTGTRGISGGARVAFQW
jgi:hypothetical protein